MLSLLVVWLIQFAQAESEKWPRLADVKDKDICAQALKVADASFNSNEYDFSNPTTVPTDFGSISDDSFLESHEGKYEFEDATDIVVHWQRVAKNGYRFVERKSPHSWRGDNHTYFVIKDDVTLKAFVSGTKASEEENPVFKEAYDTGLQAPLLYQTRDTATVWMIGTALLGFSEWGVVRFSAQGALPICDIQFVPGKASGLFVGHPAISALRTHLESMLGSGQNEGTLNPTARLKMEGSYALMNAMTRPWAILNAKPNNSRASIDSHLTQRSKKSPALKKEYKTLISKYEKAEAELAALYQNQFHKSPEEARTQASEALDLAFRSYFAFP